MCSLCQAVFARFTDLLAHHKAVHNSDTNHPLRCRACGRTQTSEAGLIYHQVYVCKMVERPHACQLCGLKFQTEEMVWCTSVVVALERSMPVSSATTTAQSPRVTLKNT